MVMHTCTFWRATTLTLAVINLVTSSGHGCLQVSDGIELHLSQRMSEKNKNPTLQTCRKMMIAFSSPAVFRPASQHWMRPIGKCSHSVLKAEEVCKFGMVGRRRPRHDSLMDAMHCSMKRGKGSEGEDQGWSGDEEVSAKSICRQLETSFRRVWLRLFTTGADDNYAMELKEFVQATIGAFETGYSLPALILELSRHELETGDSSVDKTVRLTDQERQTREVWLVLVYLTLHRINHKVPSGIMPPPRPSDTLGLGALVDSTCEAFSAGYSLEALRLELTVRSSEAPLTLTPAQVSLRSQWTRIVFITCQLVKGGSKR